MMQKIEQLKDETKLKCTVCHPNYTVKFKLVLVVGDYVKAVFIMLAYLHPLPHTSPGFQPFSLLRSPVKTNKSGLRPVTGLTGWKQLLYWKTKDSTLK